MLTPGCPYKVGHPDHPTVACSIEGGGQCDILNVPPCQPDLPCQQRQVHVTCQRCFAREHDFPDVSAMYLIGKGKFHYHLNSSDKSLVHMLTHIGCKDGDPVVFFH